jgi:hypothetical protein
VCLVDEGVKGEYTKEERPDEMEKKRRGEGRGGEGRGAREMFGLPGDWVRVRLMLKCDRNKVGKMKLSPRSQSNQWCKRW